MVLQLPMLMDVTTGCRVGPGSVLEPANESLQDVLNPIRNYGAINSDAGGWRSSWSPPGLQALEHPSQAASFDFRNWTPKPAEARGVF